MKKVVQALAGKKEISIERMNMKFFFIDNVSGRKLAVPGKYKIVIYMDGNEKASGASCKTREASVFLLICLAEKTGSFTFFFLLLFFSFLFSLSFFC